MTPSSKKVMFVDLEKGTSEIKSFPDLKMYLGGVGLGTRLYEMYKEGDPVIFAVGPLNGFFPFVSKTAVILQDDDNVEDIYVGGYLSSRIRFSGLDALVLLNSSQDTVTLSLENDTVNLKNPGVDIYSLGLPGKRSLIHLSDNKLLVDDYFQPPEDILFRKLSDKKVNALSITATKTFNLPDMQRYTEIFKGIMEKTVDMEVEKGFFPSCAGCPMGCEKSKTGEIGGNLLVHSLVACNYAEKIYSDVGTVFSCLNVLGYDYTHEDIESLPELVQNTLRRLS